MKAASVNEIKQELKHLPPAQLIELCLRLVRHKKENKELLGFLLFDAGNLPSFIQSIKEEIDEGFAEMNRSNLYFVKKSLRKILRNTGKYIRYAADKEVEIELLLHYCTNFKGLKIPAHKNTALINLYSSQIKKIRVAIATLHEDLQHDYLKQVHRLEVY